MKVQVVFFSKECYFIIISISPTFMSHSFLIGFRLKDNRNIKGKCLKEGERELQERKFEIWYLLEEGEGVVEEVKAQWYYCR